MGLFAFRRLRLLEQALTGPAPNAEPAASFTEADDTPPQRPAITGTRRPRRRPSDGQPPPSQ